MTSHIARQLWRKAGPAHTLKHFTSCASGRVDMHAEHGTSARGRLSPMFRVFLAFARGGAEGDSLRVRPLQRPGSIELALRRSHQPGSLSSRGHKRLRGVRRPGRIKRFWTAKRRWASARNLHQTVARGVEELSSPLLTR